MDELLNLTVSGLVAGAIYSIMASGLVLTYTTSGIFNFAHGAIAFATAYLYYQLHVGLGMPIVPALVIAAFLFAPLLGLLLDWVLLRRLARGPVYARIVGTIGLLVLLPNFVQWLVVTLGIKVLDIGGLVSTDQTAQGAPVPGIGPSPAHVYRPIGHVVVNSDQLAVFGVAALAAIVLWFVIRRTRLGLEMRALVDSERLAELRGINVRRASAVAWVLTMVLAGLGGVLIAPLFTLTDFVYTLVVLGALAAVVLGGLRSIPIAFAGGLGLGVLQNLVAGYSDRFLPKVLADLTGLKPAVPFFLTLVFLLVFGRDRSRRAGTVADDVPRPDHRRGLPAWRRRLPWIIATAALVAYAEQWITVDPFHADTYGQTVIAQGLAMAIIFLSFVVVTGMGGMVSLAQATFVTVGGFSAGWAVTRDWGFDLPLVAVHGHLNLFWAVVLASLVAAVVGAVVGVAITRLGGVSFALGTLAVALVATLVVFPIDAIGHGSTGWSIPQPVFSIPVLNQINDLVVRGHQSSIDTSLLSEQILLFLAMFGLIALSIQAFQRSASGRAALASRSSAVAAEASGIRVNQSKVLLFAFSSAIAAVGGVMLGLFNFHMTTSTAPPLAGLYWLALAVTFGVRRPGGALIAGLALACATAMFHWIGDVLPGGAANDLLTSPYFLPMLSGLGAIQLAKEPDGILALVGHRRRTKRLHRDRLAVIAAADAAVHRDTIPDHERIAGETVAARATMVDATPSDFGAIGFHGIVAGYDDVEVLHGIDLVIQPGTIVALLGANGAGKSTLCSVAAGFVTPTVGTVTLAGSEITTMAPFARARAGLVVLPEARGVFPGLTVDENLAVGLRDATAHAEAYDRFPELAARRPQLAGLLSGGEQQLLSLAPALVRPPAVLIADEPTLGLAPMVAERVINAILELRASGTTVLLVEEHAQNALRVADTLVLMELGFIVWAGHGQDVEIDRLARAYLGAGASLSPSSHAGRPGTIRAAR